VKMKTYKVLKCHLYDRLMSTLRGEQNAPMPPPLENTNPEPIVTPVEKPSLETIPEELAPTEVTMEVDPVHDVTVVQEEKPTCTYAINYQMGEGIKRAPQENWLSFHQFTQKRKQREDKKRKCRKKLGRC